MARRRRLLLTGATGFIGGALLPRLAERYEVIALGRHTPAATGYVDWLDADLRAPLPLGRLPKRLDAVVHLASLRTPSPGHGVDELFRVNAAAVAALVDYAGRAGARRFVLGSTGGIHGYRSGPIRETAPAAPFDAYTLSKWHGEQIAQAATAQAVASRRAAPSVAVVRYYFPYGPGQRAGIIRLLMMRIAAGEPILLHRGGRYPRINPVFIDDACALTALAVDSTTALTVNCAGPETATVREIAALIGDATGRPPRFARATGTSVGDMVASGAAARRLLGFTPRVGLRDGIAATISGR